MRASARAKRRSATRRREESPCTHQDDDEIYNQIRSGIFTRGPSVGVIFHLVGATAPLPSQS
eukprot:5914643-Pyramimonas_sp.AAC.1